MPCLLEVDVVRAAAVPGTVPTFVTTLAQLATLSLSNDSLSGAVPGGLSALQSTLSYVLALYDNDILH